MCLEREKDFEQRVSKDENLRDVQHINIRFTYRKFRTSSQYFPAKAFEKSLEQTCITRILYFMNELLKKIKHVNVLVYHDPC